MVKLFIPQVTLLTVGVTHCGASALEEEAVGLMQDSAMRARNKIKNVLASKVEGVLPTYGAAPTTTTPPTYGARPTAAPAYTDNSCHWEQYPMKSLGEVGTIKCEGYNCDDRGGFKMNVDACKAECEKRETCIGFEFYRGDATTAVDDACYLSGEIAYDDADCEWSDVYVQQCATTTTTTLDDCWQVQDSMTFVESTLMGCGDDTTCSDEGGWPISREACKSKCLDTPNCMGFTYVRDDAGDLCFLSHRTDLVEDCVTAEVWFNKCPLTTTTTTLDDCWYFSSLQSFEEKTLKCEDRIVLKMVVSSWIVKDARGRVRKP